MESAREVGGGARSRIVGQVANGGGARMAVLCLLVGGAEPAIGRDDQETTS